MKKRKAAGIILKAILVVTVVFLIYSIIVFNTRETVTERVEKGVAYDIYETDCFIVRDEMKTSAKNNTAIITNNGEGVYVPYVEDGSRVGSGDPIALFFSSQSGAKNYTEKKYLEGRLEFFTKLQNQSGLSTFDIDKLESTINENIDSLLECIERGDLESAAEKAQDVKYFVSSKQIATGEDVSFEKQIKKINKQLKNLTGSDVSYKTISASFSGFFISDADGYEAVADYTNVENYGVEDVSALLKSDPAKVKSNVIGKIVDAFNWYACSIVPEKIAKKFSIGSTLRISFKNTDVTDLNMSVVAISPVVDGESALILKSHDMNSDIAKLRLEKIRIYYQTYEGLKINNDAITNLPFTSADEDGNEVTKDYVSVLIKNGEYIHKRKVEVVHYDEDFVIAAVHDESDYVKLYDEVIVKGRNIKDADIRD